MEGPYKVAPFFGSWWILIGLEFQFQVFRKLHLIFLHVNKKSDQRLRNDFKDVTTFFKNYISTLTELEAMLYYKGTISIPETGK